MSEKREQQEFVDKLTQQMEKQNLDALYLTTADAIFYATGYASSNLYRSGQSGSDIAVVTKDGKVYLVVGEFELHSAQKATENVTVTAYPTWIFIEDYAVEGMKKEVQPDLNKTYKLATQFLPESDKNQRIGVQPESLPHYAWTYLTETFGEQNLIDIKTLLVEARVIKTSWEISLLRRAARYSELTMHKIAKEVVPGMTEADVVRRFNELAFSWSSDIVSVSNAHTIAANFTPSYIPLHTRINRGDLIRLDGGPNVSGYNSDLARTFAVGGVTSADKEELYANLWAGYEFAKNNIGPGVRMCDIFNGIHKLLDERGFKGYVRGHQGHSLGCSIFAEEYPFIAPDETRVFEPGMVMNLEMPYYSSKHQTYNIEDTFLVTETGVEFFSQASPSLYY